MKNTKIILTLFIFMMIITICYPIIKVTGKNKEKEVIIKNVNSIIATAKEYYSSNNIVEDYVIFNIKDGKIQEDGLIYDGKLPSEGKILINSSGEIQIVAQEKNWCVTKNYSDDNLNIIETTDKCEVLESTKLGNINISISQSGDGLYQSNNEYTFRGSNPNNYFELNNELYRIVKIDANGNIELILNDVLDERTWNIKSVVNNSFNILDSDNIAYYLNNLETKNNNFNLIRTNTYLLEYSWTAEKFNYSNKKIYYELKQEYASSVVSIVGLLSATDYIRASLDSMCAIDSLRNTACGNENYLNINTNYFTLSRSSDAIWAISNDGKLYETSIDIKLAVRPTIYLNSDISLSGRGTVDNPYKIVIN